MIQTNPLEILAKLIEMPSVTPDQAGTVDYIENIITHLGGIVERIDSGNTANLLATIGTGEQTLAFAGHVDVVPSGNHDKWLNQNPFKLHQHGDNLVGRGVVDMKGAIAAFLSALISFTSNTPMDKYKIMLIITSDEEGPATDGTIKVVEKLQREGRHLDYCIIGEPTSSSIFGDTIKVGRRGSLTGELTVFGKQGHIAYPDLCINPIHKALPALSELSKLVWDNGNEHFPSTSLQFANLNSGLGVTNVIPGQLITNFNFRYNTIHNAEDLILKTETILKKHQLDYSITWKHSAKPFLTKVAGLVEVCKDAIKEICNIIPDLKTDGGTSDGRFLIDVSNELVELGLLNTTAHQINETTTISDLTQLTEVYNRILCKIFNG
jgi:succinyl-diaminopimelate desuccinylase